MINNKKTKQVYSAGLILFRQDAKSHPLFLLLFSRTSKYWGFPKGGLKTGENNLEASVRETKEETGIANFFILAGFKTKYQYSYVVGDKLHKEEVILRAAKTEAQKIKLSREHSKCAWVDYETAQKMIIYPNIKKTLKRLNVFLDSKNNLIDSQERVYEETAKICKGNVSSYGSVGAKIKINPRLVGLILKLNYDASVPCHRIIRRDCAIGGYNRGGRNKIEILKAEGVKIKGNKVTGPV